jgi:hypothetical protein
MTPTASRSPFGKTQAYDPAVGTQSIRTSCQPRACFRSDVQDGPSVPFLDPGDLDAVAELRAGVDRCLDQGLVKRLSPDHAQQRSLACRRRTIRPEREKTAPRTSASTVARAAGGSRLYETAISPPQVL